MIIISNTDKEYILPLLEGPNFIKDIEEENTDSLKVKYNDQSINTLLHYSKTNEFLAIDTDFLELLNYLSIDHVLNDAIYKIIKMIPNLDCYTIDFDKNLFPDYNEDIIKVILETSLKYNLKISELFKFLENTNNIPLIKYLINNYNPEKYNELNYDFKFVCQKGNLEIVEIFLQKKYNLIYGLKGACRGGQLKVVELLIEHGVFKLARAPGSYFPLEDACKSGNIDLVKLLIKRKETIIGNGLEEACKMGHLKIVELLIRYDVNRRFELRLNSALEEAFIRNKVEIVEFLYEKGAKSGDAATLRYNCEYEQIDLVKLLIKRGVHNQKEFEYGFLSACYKGNLELVELMIHHGANNFTEGLDKVCYGTENYYNYNRNHNTYRLDIVKLLIQRGAKVTNANLVYACRGGQLEIAKILIENGANDFDTAFINACESDNVDLVKLLLSLGARKSIKVFNNVCRIGKVEIFKLLFDKNIDLNYALYETCKSRCNEELIDLLLEYGANNWNCGLEYAYKNENLRLVKLFLEKGANNVNDILKRNYYLCKNSEIITLMIKNLTDHDNEELINNLIKYLYREKHYNIINLLKNKEILNASKEYQYLKELHTRINKILRTKFIDELFPDLCQDIKKRIIFS